MCKVRGETALVPIVITCFQSPNGRQGDEASSTIISTGKLPKYVGIHKSVMFIRTVTSRFRLSHFLYCNLIKLPLLANSDTSQVGSEHVRRYFGARTNIAVTAGLIFILKKWLTSPRASA